jgi:LPXTG-site transpeptidase (sortase) family protein
MDTKSRITMDKYGMRTRPRGYLDSHVPKRVVPRVGNDVGTPSVSRPKVTVLMAKPMPVGEVLSVMTPSRVPKETVPSPKSQISTEQIAVTARQMLDQRSVHKPQISAEAYSSPLAPIAESIVDDTAIAGLVRSIQHSNETAVNPAFYDTSSSHIEPIEPEDKVSFITNVQKGLQVIRYNWSKRSMLASAMALLLMVGGLVALFSSIHSNRVVAVQVQALSEKSDQNSDAASGQSSGTTVPSEDKVPDAVVSSYSVSSDLPKYISIPKIKISKTRILRMGLDKDGSIKTPRNVWDTGWYEGSSKPGDSNGAALVMGHVSGPTNGGIFYNLYRLTDGDMINITQGDGTIYSYKVVSKEEVPADGMNMNNYLVSKNVDKPGLTLMTCAGEFNPKTQTFDKRLAVFAIRTN